MRTGELARRAGIGKATLEHYLRLGLVRPIAVGEQGYRLFGDDALLRLRAIRAGRQAGFTLGEVQSALTVVSPEEFDRLITTLPPVQCRRELAARGAAVPE